MEVPALTTTTPTPQIRSERRRVSSEQVDATDGLIGGTAHRSNDAPKQHEAVPGARSFALVEFSEELRNDVAAGRITVSFRLWKRPRVKVGGRYRIGPATIEVDSIELVPFATISEADVRRSGEIDRDGLRRRAAHAGPIDDTTMVYRVEFHVVV